MVTPYLRDSSPFVFLFQKSIINSKLQDNQENSINFAIEGSKERQQTCTAQDTARRHTRIIKVLMFVSHVSHIL